MKKKIPAFKTDAQAERFVANSDLAQHDLSGAKAVQFEFQELPETSLQGRVQSE